MKVVTVENMRAIEAAIDASGISYEELMNRAGRAAADRAKAILSKLGVPEPRITVLVGKGNNGGDGLVAGLLIAQDHPDADVRFYLLEERPEDDRLMHVVKEASLFYVVAEGDSDKRVLRNMVASADLLIDALFGIGMRPPLRDEAARVLRSTNQAINERRRSRPQSLVFDAAQANQIPRPSRLYVLAIDGPSGLQFDTGEIDKNAIPADESITFIAAKRGLYTFPGAATVGRITLADLGISQSFPELKSEPDIIVDSETVREMLPERSPDANKGTFGKALLIAGSANYMGAAVLCAEAAYRSGAGLVTVGTPRPVAAALAGSQPETTWLLLPHDMGVLSETAVSVLLDEIENYSAMLIGPGLSNEKPTQMFLTALLAQTRHQPRITRRAIGFQNNLGHDEQQDNDTKAELPPLVIDADGLNILSGIDDWPELLPEGTIITPHPGEMGRLAQITTSEVVSNRWELAREKAQAWQTVLVLKGAHTLIATPEGTVYVLPFKSDALATAGTGDVLAGLITGLLAQGLDSEQAAVAGAYIHGLAGTYAAHNTSTRSIVAGDVILAIGAALTAIEA